MDTLSDGKKILLSNQNTSRCLHDNIYIAFASISKSSKYIFKENIYNEIDLQCISLYIICVNLDGILVLLQINDESSRHVRLNALANTKRSSTEQNDNGFAKVKRLVFDNRALQSSYQNEAGICTDEHGEQYLCLGEENNRMNEQKRFLCNRNTGCGKRSFPNDARGERLGKRLECNSDGCKITHFTPFYSLTKDERQKQQAREQPMSLNRLIHSVLENFRNNERNNARDISNTDAKSLWNRMPLNSCGTDTNNCFKKNRKKMKKLKASGR